MLDLHPSVLTVSLLYSRGLGTLNFLFLSQSLQTNDIVEEYKLVHYWQA